MTTIRRLLLLLGVVGTLTVLSAACSSDSGESGTGAATTEASEGGTESAEEELSYAEGGADWEEFEPACAGSSQSPIDLAEAVDGDVADPVVDWPSVDLEIENKGHTTEVYVPPGESTTMLQGEEWELVRFHWHEPSEHVRGDDTYDMELHFVHQRTVGGATENAVLGVLIEAGEANPAYDPIWAAQPAEEGAREPLDAVIDLTTLLPDDLTTVTYEGSLTTPPCSEGISWNVLTTPATISAEQIEAFAYPGTAREAQELNGREVTADST